MVAAALTVTSIREKVVNFVHPFKNLGLSILVKRASNDIPENSFINYNVFTPFSLSAWILICVAYLLVREVLKHIQPSYHTYDNRLSGGSNTIPFLL